MSSYIPDYAVDSVPPVRLLRSLVRRALGRCMQPPDNVRFTVLHDANSCVTTVIDRLHDTKMYLETPTAFDRYTVDEVFSERAYTLEGLRRQSAVLDCLRRQTTIGTPLIIDGGANIGASSLLFSVIYPDAKVIAVEPAPRNAALLARNCRGQPAVELVEAALGEADGEALFSSEGNPRGHCITTAGSIRVRMVSVDSLLAQFPDATPFLMKLDIEGAEDQMFVTDVGWIDRFPVIVIEPHDWKYPKSARITGFLRNVAGRDRDFLVVGENIVSVSNSLVE